MIPGYDRYDFGETLNSLISPSQPIRSIQYLRGRDSELDRIEKALFASGRNIFIYGDRGVGKSSLAATAANQYQDSYSEYIESSGSPDATLASVVRNIALQATNASRLINIVSKSKITGNFRFLNVDSETQSNPNDLKNEICSIQDATEVLKEVASLYIGNKIVVIDEFDRIESAAQRHLFADLLKHLGDQGINLKFIITGVGNSIDGLLGAHPSAIRQLETIELPKLSWEARWDIVIKTLENFNITIDRSIYTKIAAISDGYPFYVHLITEKLLWRLFEKNEYATTVGAEDYANALNDAIESISAELKKPYEAAIINSRNDYEEVLWSTADSDWLDRSLGDMYLSYKTIVSSIPEMAMLNYDNYATRIRNLCKSKYGSVLYKEKNKKGIYKYRDKIFRGYVRMQAEAHGVNLPGVTEDKAPRQTIRVRTGTKRSIKISSGPRGFK